MLSYTAAITGLRFEHLADAFGIGVPCPRLSWTIAATTADWRQAGYEVEAYRPDGELWTQRGCARTGRVESGESVLVPWPFAPLISRSGYRSECAFGAERPGLP